MKRNARLGLGVLLVGVVACFVATTGVRSNPPSKEKGAVRTSPQQAQIEQEVASLPEGEVEVASDTFPAVHRLMQVQLNAVFPDDRTAAQRPRLKSAQMVPTSGGLLTVYELGDGVVRLLATAIDRSQPDDANPALVFSAVVTQDGIDVTSLNEAGLARFVGAAVSDESDTVGIAAAASEIGPCQNNGGVTCCLVVTNTKACVCCFSLVPNSVPSCSCVDLHAY